MKSAAESPVDAPPSPTLSASQLATLASLGEERAAAVGDVLYGVSMPPGGSTRVVSQRVSDVVTT